ncbi:MAG: hypothetical protein L6R37_002647 [Teloschistes peruensis]|nr:MAG: hypothetical protein L6R37_002647 [Teloschistes peruensis]
MGSTFIDAPEYWGYLIKSDKSPSIIFEQLLLGIANYINRHVTPWDVECLTPTKLAAFYRLVGGDLDTLFLDTPQASLSFIYQSLGCYHTLQPEKDPFVPPRLPALTPQGFVRWQTVQVLLKPDVHVPFLQNAVKRLDIINPTDGLPFPHPLPWAALPSRPDPEMVQWHEGVGETLMIASQATPARASSIDRPRAIDPVSAEPSLTSFDDGHSLIDIDRNIDRPQQPPVFRPPPGINLPQSINCPPALTPNGRPWDLERRRSSTSDLHSSLPLSNPSYHFPNTRNSDRYSGVRHRPQSPSTASTSSVSSSDSSSISGSSASMSPRLSHARHYHQPHHGPQRHHQPASHHERRHSSNEPYAPRVTAESPNAQARHIPDDRLIPRQPTRPPGSNSRGLNVRWEDVDSRDSPIERPVDPRNQNFDPSAAERRRSRDSDQERGGRTRRESRENPASTIRGVGGRVYAAEGVDWT